MIAVAPWLLAAAPAAAVPPLLPAPASPEPSVQSTPQPEAPAVPKTGKLKIGGAIRARYDLRFNDRGNSGARRTSNHVSFDTLLLTADYDSPVFFGSAQYRFYGASFLYSKSAGYEGIPGEVNFPVYAYVGAKLGARDKVTVGLQNVPFDDRYWGSSFYSSLGYVYGLEETYNVGVTYSHTGQDVSLDAGFFPTTAPGVMGISGDSARFSVNLVKADPGVPSASRNAERNMMVGRVQYRFSAFPDTKFTLSGSAWVSQVHNFDTGRDGSRQAYAASLRAEKGRWHAKALAAHQDIDPRNAGRNDLVAVGNYDSTYNIAAKGTLLFGEVGRTIDTGKLPFDLTLFASYARFLKNGAFKDGTKAADTQRINVGAFWKEKEKGRVRIWTEFLLGRNDPYVGAGQFSSGAAQGADNRWKLSFLMLGGYYF